MGLSPSSWPGGGSFSGGTIDGPLTVRPSSGGAFLAAVGPAAGSGAQLGVTDNDTGAGLYVFSPETGEARVLDYPDTGGTFSIFAVSDTGAVELAAHAAPADAAIHAGECFLWFDQTNGVGNTKLMVKAKSADGTVKTASIVLA